MPEPRPVAIDSLDDLIRIPPFHAYLGVVVEHAASGQAVLRLPPKEEFVGNPLVPAIHGGITSALIDLAGGAALFVDLRFPTPTVDMRVDFLRPAVAGRALRADARVTARGRRVAFVDVDVYQPAGDGTVFATAPTAGASGGDRLVAQGRCVYSVVPPAAVPGEPYPIG